MKKKNVFTIFLVIIAFGLYVSGQKQDRDYSSFKVKTSKSIKNALTQKKQSSVNRTIATEAQRKVSRRAPAQRNDYTAQDSAAKERARKIHELERARQASRQNKKKRFDFLNAMGEGFRLEPDKQAMPVSEGEIPGAQIVSGHYIVQGRPGAASLPVVKTERGTYAVFTGVVKVMLAKSADPYQVGSDFGGEVQNVYEHINSVYLKYYDYGEAIAAYKGLKIRPHVKSVELEVLEHSRQPR